MSKEWSMDQFIRPDVVSTCTWHRNADPSTSPHTKRSVKPIEKKISPDVFSVIGNTPMIRLNKIPKTEGLKCELLGKCEYLNPGGSVKDRIAVRMIEEAEQKGILKPGYTIIEPTSGNTGIGLAMAAAVKGYRCIIVLPLKMSDEKVNVLKALGAEIIRTPTYVPYDSPESVLVVAQKLQKQTPNSVVLDQFRNMGNPLAHYDETAAEIIEQCDGKIDMVVMGAGTGGTMTGVGRKIKELCPNCKVIGVDPLGSLIAQPAELNVTDVKHFDVEGIGYTFASTVCDRSVVDKWYKISDAAAFNMSRRLIKEEGLLVGGSSGSAIVGALKAAAELKEGQRCVVILADSIRNYLSKFVSDQWMVTKNLKPLVNVHNHWWWDQKVSTLNLEAPSTLLSTATCSQAQNVMRKLGVNQIAIANEDGSFEGIATLPKLMNQLIAMDATAKSPVTQAMDDKFITVNVDSPLGMVSKILEKDPFAVVVKETKSKEEVVGIITTRDLLDYITTK